jgi:hypothetical protein
MLAFRAEFGYTMFWQRSPGAKQARRRNLAPT